MFNIIGDDIELGGVVVAKIVVPEGTLRERVICGLDNAIDAEMISVEDHEKELEEVRDEFSDCCSAEERLVLENQCDLWEQKYHDQFTETQAIRADLVADNNRLCEEIRALKQRIRELKEAKSVK